MPGIDGFDLANEECVAEVTKQLHTLDEQKFSKNFLQTQMFVFYYEQYMQEGMLTALVIYYLIICRNQSRI